MQFINPIGRYTTVNCKYITLDFYTIPPDFPPQFHHHTQFMFADNLVVKYAAVLPMVLRCQTLPNVDYGSRTLPSLVIPLPDIAIEDPVGVGFGGGEISNICSNTVLLSWHEIQGTLCCKRAIQRIYFVN